MDEAEDGGSPLSHGLGDTVNMSYLPMEEQVSAGGGRPARRLPGGKANQRFDLRLGAGQGRAPRGPNGHPHRLNGHPSPARYEPGAQFHAHCAALGESAAPRALAVIPWLARPADHARINSEFQDGSSRSEELRFRVLCHTSAVGGVIGRVSLF
jgi:hypothetical protein